MIRGSHTLAVLLMAATAPAWASTVTFTLSSGGAASQKNDVLTYIQQGITLTLTGYTCGANVVCDTEPTQTNSEAELHVSALGVGMANDRPAGIPVIPRTEYVQVDFSTLPVNATVTSVTFQMTDLTGGWDIYMSAIPGELDSSYNSASGPVVAAAQGNNQTGYPLADVPDINSTVAHSATTGTSTLSGDGTGYYDVTALQDSGQAVLESITISYETPEPATIFIVGCALILIGSARRRKKAETNGRD